MFSMHETAKGVDITLTRGDTLLAQIGVMYDGQPYVPVQGDHLRIAVKHPQLNDDRTEYVDQEPLILREIPWDTLLLRLEPTDTKPLGFGKYDYDIQITFADGRVDTFINGTLTLTKEVD